MLDHCLSRCKKILVFFLVRQQTLLWSISISCLRMDSLKEQRFFALGISSLFMFCVYLILVFLSSHHVCFVKPSLNVYAVLQASVQRAELRNFCLCHLNNLPYITGLEWMLCFSMKRQFVFSQQRRGGRGWWRQDREEIGRGKERPRKQEKEEQMIGGRVMGAGDESYGRQLKKGRGIVNNPLVCSKKYPCSYMCSMNCTALWWMFIFCIRESLWKRRGGRGGIKGIQGRKDLKEGKG